MNSLPQGGQFSGPSWPSARNHDQSRNASLQSFAWPDRVPNASIFNSFPSTYSSQPPLAPLRDQLPSFAFASTNSSHDKRAIAPATHSQGLQNQLPLNELYGRTSDQRNDPAQPSSGRRSNKPKYNDADWEPYREKIKRLYLMENKSAEETQDIMKREDGFCPTVRMYKDKFNQWHWFKNLPAPAAQWMANKVEERRRQEKATVFHYGGQTWTEERVQKSLQRARARGNEALENTSSIPTILQGIQLVTPSPASSPLIHNLQSPRIAPAVSGRWTPAPTPHTPRADHLQLVWHGHNRASLDALVKEAQELRVSGDIPRAVEKYREALAGLERLVSATHEDTVELAYELAESYTQLGQTFEADQVLDWMSRKFVERWGLKHDNSLSHFFRVADMYTNWSRGKDANAMLYRIIDSYGTDGKLSTTDRDRISLPPMREAPTSDAPLARSGDVQTAVMANRSLFSRTDDPTLMDYQLGLAKNQVDTDDESAEPLLLGLIEQCVAARDKLARQELKARCLLITLYLHKGDSQKLDESLEEAKETVEAVLTLRSKKTESVFEACIDVAAKQVEHRNFEDAEDILERICRDGENEFGSESDIFIRVIIRIGKMYEIYDRWADAQLWYEQALCASIAVYGRKASLTTHLEEALESKYFAPHLAHADLFKANHSHNFDYSKLIKIDQVRLGIV